MIYWEKGGANMYYYQRLKDLREDSDKSQAEIAKILNISQQHYSQYERGERELPMHLFIELANYYNASLDYMTGRTNNKGGFLARKNLEK